VVIPRLVVAAPASGSGKTTVATGLIAALTAQGLDVSPHKVGPDYIDPGYHALAAGRPGRNLDPWLTAEELVAPLFLHGARDADIAVVEGVMGLYDGAAGAGEFASTAHVAKLLGAPVVLVVDAASAGRSVAALVHGFVTYDSGVRIGGVILNRVGSPRHETLLRDALAEVGVPVLGAVTRAAEVAAPSRHLGLVPVAERAPESVAIVTALA
jgi:cobyrinic acid a,c-diamide synthase